MFGPTPDPAGLGQFWLRWQLAEETAAAQALVTGEDAETILERRAATRDRTVSAIDATASQIADLIRRGEALPAAAQALEQALATRVRRVEDWAETEAQLAAGAISLEAYLEKERRYTRETAADMVTLLEVVSGGGGLISGSARRAGLAAASHATRRAGDQIWDAAMATPVPRGLGGRIGGDAVYRNPETGANVPRPRTAPLSEVGLGHLSETDAVAKARAIPPVPSVRNRDDLKAFYAYLNARTEEDLALSRTRGDLREQDALERQLRRAAAIEAADGDLPVKALQGRHEWFTIASLISVKRSGLPIETMVSRDFTSPTSIKFLAPDGKTSFGHNEPSKPVAARLLLPKQEQKRLEAAGKYSQVMHDQLETLHLLVSKLPEAERRRGLAVGMNAHASQWLPNGAADLPIGFQALIEAEGFDLARRTVILDGPTAIDRLLDAYPDELRNYAHLRDAQSQ